VPFFILLLQEERKKTLFSQFDNLNIQSARERDGEKKKTLAS
jgi:hypothetical protein